MSDQRSRPVGYVSEDVSISVLVVDDLRDTAVSVAQVLSLCGFSHVSMASTGGAALKLAAEDPPDVVLLDMELPDMDGWEVARSLREKGGATGKRPLVVAVTGYGLPDDRRRSAEVGVDLHLVKPVEPAVLVGVLRRFAQVLTPGPEGDAN